MDLSVNLSSQYCCMNRSVQYFHCLFNTLVWSLLLEISVVVNVDS